MSELKATTVYDVYWKANSVGEGTGILVYLKSEADKTITHQKYKRCLAMANWCQSEQSLHPNAFGLVSYKGLWWRTWRKRWLELAEKFKETK